MLCSRLLGALAALVGLVVLAGWIFDPPWLLRLAPGWDAMRPNTALAVVLGAAAVLLLSVAEGPARRTGPIVWIARAAGAAVLLLGLASLAEDVMDLDLGIDDLLPRRRRAAALRMPVHTGLAVAALGAAALLRGAGRRLLSLLAEPFALTAIAVPVLALIGHAYGAPDLYDVRSHAPMAVHAALILVLLGAALLCAAPDRGLAGVAVEPGAGGATLRRLLPVALGVPLLLGWLLLRGEAAGLYGTAMGTALFAFSLAVIFTAFACWHAIALRRSEADLRRQAALIDEAHDAILVWRLGREIVFWNRGVGSSRVDLQACKLEYSIVSPK